MTTSSTTASTRWGAPREALDQTPGSTSGEATEAAPGAELGFVSRPAPSGLADGVRLLEQAVQTLETATEAGDADLARTCRDVLDSLRSHRASTDTDGSEVVTDESAGSLPPPRVPLTPPGWARGSLAEDGGIVHELVSPLHPTIRAGGARSFHAMPTDVSLSVTDLLIDGRWIRTRPTVQVESGSYDLDGARQLHDALQQLLAAAEAVASHPATP